MAEEPLASIEFTFHGSAVGLYGLKGPDVGRLLVQIDDQEPFDATFFYVSSNPYRHFLKSVLLAGDLPQNIASPPRLAHVATQQAGIGLTHPRNRLTRNEMVDLVHFQRFIWLAPSNDWYVEHGC